MFQVAITILVANLTLTLWDTWADSVCIPQLVFNPRSKLPI